LLVSSAAAAQEECKTCSKAEACITAYHVLGGVIELDDTFELQVIAHTVKIDVRNTIPEDIMKPSHL
jgi:hypothetical protein